MVNNCLAIKKGELCLEWHPIKNGELTPEKESYGSTQKVWWICQVCKHEWQENVNRRYHGSPCPICKKKKIEEVKTTCLNEMKDYANSKGGVCLSDKYINAHKKLIFECKEGHRFEINANKIRTYSTWCRKCTFKEIADSQRGTIEDMKVLAKEKEGKCLSDVYINAREKLLWECKKGHTWEATPDNVKRGSWCPTCKIFINEEKCRFIVQNLTGKSFPKIRSIFNNAFELDGYNDELKIGFEYHGRQHYQFIKRWHKTVEDLNKRINDDELKIELCKVNGIRLIVIPYSLDTDIQKIKYIKNELTKHGVELVVKTVNMKNFRSNLQTLERYASIARSKGGKCLSEIYVSAHTPLEWECAKGHNWFATPTNIQQDKWCKQCLNEQKGMIRDGFDSERSLKFRNPELAAEWHPKKNEGLDPGDVLVSSHQKVWWIGKCGHEWKAKIRDRQVGGGCHVCSGKIKTLENCLATKYPALAKEWNTEKNGSLTPFEVTPGMRKKVWWKCLVYGHEWESYIYNRVDVPSRKGRGCPRCRRNTSTSITK
ncbi:zinc-ribbon domain-containing protein [Neobacillus sp. SAB-20_R2A]|uniref:zinc-ribbon domain-containing protein n=1 Tax=Neobacillus sp. SAB-20_R2A TaxID=3120519 RepID=UPI003C6E51B0